MVPRLLTGTSDRPIQLSLDCLTRNANSHLLKETLWQPKTTTSPWLPPAQAVLNSEDQAKAERGKPEEEPEERDVYRYRERERHDNQYDGFYPHVEQNIRLRSNSIEEVPMAQGSGSGVASCPRRPTVKKRLYELARELEVPTRAVHDAMFDLGYRVISVATPMTDEEIQGMRSRLGVEVDQADKRDTNE